MEPLKAVSLIAAAGAFALISAGAFGFYVGYSAGASRTAVAVVSKDGSATSLQPVLDDLRALSKQVDALSQLKTAAPVEPQQPMSLKPVLDEIRTLSRQIEANKPALGSISAPQEARQLKAIDYSDQFESLKQEVKALSAKIDKPDPRVSKALSDEVRLMSTALQNQELVNRKAILDELHASITTLQNIEPHMPKGLAEDIKAISVSLTALRGQDRMQPSLVDQIKVLNASVEAIRARLADGSVPSNTGGVANANRGASDADLADIKAAISLLSDQVNKCQGASSFGTTVQQTNGGVRGGTTAVALSQAPKEGAVVFFDSVMLRKDQDKQYNEIGVHLNLQSVTPRQVHLAVNRQAVALAFGERKVFRVQDLDCELNLMETNLNDAQARVSLSCRR